MQSWELTITPKAWHQLCSWLAGSDQERGCLLGASNRLERIDSVIPVPGLEEATRFRPDMDAVNAQIHRWAAEGICFRGLVHSHPGGPSELSDRDLETIEAWTRAAELPNLCFGIAVCRRDQTELRLWCSACLPDQTVQLYSFVPIQRKWPWAAIKWRLSNEKTT